METYIFGIETLNMHLLLDLWLMVSIELVEVFWDLRKMILLFNVIYGTRDFPTYITKPYLGCVVGKHKEGPFPSSERKMTNIIQLVHSDLSSALHVTLLGGYTYYEIFVDGLSRKHDSIS